MTQSAPTAFFEQEATAAGVLETRSRSPRRHCFRVLALQDHWSTKEEATPSSLGQKENRIKL